MAAILFTLLLSVGQGAVTTGDRVRVYVDTTQPGSRLADADSKARTQAARDLRDRLKRRKTIAVVDLPDGADVSLEVTGVEKLRGTGAERNSRLPSVSRDDLWEVRATLRFGDFTTTFSEAKIAVIVAVVQIAQGAEKWVADNRERILAARAR